MQHIAQATKNRKVNAFVASVRVAVRKARNAGVKVGNAYRSATGDRFEITMGRDVLLVEVHRDTNDMLLLGIQRDVLNGDVTLTKPQTVRNYRAFERALSDRFGVYLA